MNTRYVTSLFTAMTACGLSAQTNGPNLVPNSGFETGAETVTTWDQLERAASWSNANAGSCDVFTKASNSKAVGIPANELGSSDAPEGSYYAGFVAWKDDMRPNFKHLLHGDQEPFREAWNNYSEYMQIELSQPLEAGKKYEIGFKVKLAGNSDRAVSAIGAYCGPNKLDYHHRHFLTEKPQVFSSKVIRDTENWTEIKGEFVADGGERVLVIGAFPTAVMDKEKVVKGADNQRAYYYVDAVSCAFAPEPDADGDGVPDKEDNCPTEPGLKTLGGCPDRDGDGVTDKMDACPDKAGAAKDQGCPDSDGDGIADNTDRCPTQPGVPSMKGCPEIKEETRKLFERALTGVKFETGKSTIKAESFKILDDVVKVMQENPTYDLEIHGHTDNQGDDAKNQKLSDDRAAAVRDYLVKKGVPAADLKSFGHGETQPVESNDTAAGRAKNRRVEFKVTFWE